MRTTILSLAALAALATGAGTADAQFVNRRGVVYGPAAYPSYYYTPQYVVPAVSAVAPVAAPGAVILPAATPSTVVVPAATPATVVVPAAAPVVGYGYYPSYYYTYPGLRRR